MEERRVEGNIYLTPCVGKQRPAFSFLWHLYTPDDSAKSNQCAAASSGSNLLRPAWATMPKLMAYFKHSEDTKITVGCLADPCVDRPSFSESIRPSDRWGSTLRASGLTVDDHCRRSHWSPMAAARPYVCAEKKVILHRACGPDRGRQTAWRYGCPRTQILPEAPLPSLCRGSFHARLYAIYISEFNLVYICGVIGVRMGIDDPGRTQFRVSGS